MEITSTSRKFSRSSSTRSSQRSHVSLQKSSFSSPAGASSPRTPQIKTESKFENSFSHPEKISIHGRSPRVSLSSPSETERTVCDPKNISSPRSPNYVIAEANCNVGSPRSPNFPPKSPRSPKIFHYGNVGEVAGTSDDLFTFDLQSPPKPHINRKNNGTASNSSSSIKSLVKEPQNSHGEYKVSHSLDSDCQTKSSSVYSTTTTSRSSRHSSSFKEKRFKPRCNIHSNPAYDDTMHGSNSFINESDRPKIHRCRKSTSDLTDMTDEVANTTMTSLSRPSSPRRKGSVKGLAYLASRRGSRDSVASNFSNASNEDIGPLNFQKYPRGRQRRTSNFLELPVPDHVRPRVCSLPEKAFNPRLSDDLYRLRTFSITNKGGVVNCGDSIINRRSRSNTSVNSTTSKASNVSGERSPFDGSCCGSGYHTVESSPLGSPEELEVPKYRVVMLGDSGVGKTALVSQFMTSEYMNTYDASLDGLGGVRHSVLSSDHFDMPRFGSNLAGNMQRAAILGSLRLLRQHATELTTTIFMDSESSCRDDEFGERTVSILLDGEESEMIFIDHPSSEMSVENSLSTYEPHACVVVYSVVARPSFQNAEETLNYLWRERYTQEKSVIVVGNKADLARSRAISQNEGKALAVARDCKFIETSSGIQHNVDELLVGVLKQIRLKETREKKQIIKKERNKLYGSKTSLSLNIAKEILQKICMNDISKSKSCENLHVL